MMVVLEEGSRARKEKGETWEERGEEMAMSRPCFRRAPKKPEAGI